MVLLTLSCLSPELQPSGGVAFRRACPNTTAQRKFAIMPPKYTRWVGMDRVKMHTMVPTFRRLAGVLSDAGRVLWCVCRVLAVACLVFLKYFFAGAIV